jgi:hypothetical protein
VRLAGFEIRSRVGQQAVDLVRDERLASVRQLVDGFTYQLALLIAGQEADLESFVDTHVALQLRSRIAPFVESGAVVRPDFGAYGELRLDGDLLDDAALIAANLEFDDKSVQETSDGQLLPSLRRRVQLCMQLALTPPRVVGLDIHLLSRA